MVSKLPKFVATSNNKDIASAARVKTKSLVCTIHDARTHPWQPFVMRKKFVNIKRHILQVLLDDNESLPTYQPVIGGKALCRWAVDHHLDPARRRMEERHSSVSQFDQLHEALLVHYVKMYRNIGPYERQQTEKKKNLPEA